MLKDFALHIRSYIPVPQNCPRISCIYNILAAFKLFCNTFHKKSPSFTSAFITLHYDIIFNMHLRHIFTQNVLRREVFGSRVKGNQKLLCNIFCLFISTVNIMNGVLCSAKVSERLKIRKSLGIHH